MMTSRAWRVMTELLIADIETILAYENKDAEVWETDDPMANRYYTELDKRIVSETKLYLINKTIDSFKRTHLNRETADDFDEYERSVG